MSSSTSKEFTLSVSTDQLGIELSILDSKGYTQASTTESRIEVNLPRGLYTVRAERNGLYEDKIVRLTESRDVSPKLPPRYSAIPLPGAQSTHEYYSYGAWEISKTNTAADIVFGGPAESEFMLFLRAPAQNRITLEEKTLDLTLRSLSGDVLSTLDQAEIQLDITHGFAGFSAKTSCGDLILEDNSTVRRQTRLPLLRNFQTQVFLMYLGRPLYEDMRVLTIDNADISTRRNRSPYDRNEFTEITDQVDVGMAALQNNVEDIGEHLVNNFLMSKFRNPILGLLGAYLMLLRRNQRPSKSYDERLPGVVLDNLTDLMPDSPDLVALKHLAADWVGTPVQSEITIPPLFRVGAEVLIKAAARQPELIPEGSLFDVVSDRILGDTAWTTWSSIELPVEKQLALDSERDNDTMSWVELAVADNLAAYKNELPVEELAERVGVTQRAINKAFFSLTKKATNHPESLQQEGFDSSLFKRIDLIRGAFTKYSEQDVEILPLRIRDINMDRLSYQGVYPTIKTALSQYSKKISAISAEDEIADLVDETQLEDIRTTLFEKIRAKYPAIQLSKVGLREGMGSMKTVRDIASMLVKKQKL